MIKWTVKIESKERSQINNIKTSIAEIATEETKRFFRIWHIHVNNLQKEQNRHISRKTLVMNSDIWHDRKPKF